MRLFPNYFGISFWDLRFRKLVSVDFRGHIRTDRRIVVSVRRIVACLFVAERVKLCSHADRRQLVTPLIDLHCMAAVVVFSEGSRAKPIT